MERIFVVFLMVLSLSSMPFPAFAMGKKPASGDSQGTASASDKQQGNPGSPDLSGASVPPSAAATNPIPVANINKPMNPNLPSNTGTSGSTGMNGTGMGSGTSH